MTVRPRDDRDLPALVTALRAVQERGPARWWVPGGGRSLLLVAPAG